MDSVFIERQRIASWFYLDGNNTVQRKRITELSPASVSARFSCQKSNARGFVAIKSESCGAIRPHSLNAAELDIILESLSNANDCLLCAYASSVKALEYIEHQWVELSPRRQETTWLLSHGQRRHLNDFAIVNAIQSNVSWLVRFLCVKYMDE